MDAHEEFLSQDDESQTPEQGAEESEESTSGAAEEDKSEESKGDDELTKRLQSERDKETARANKLQKELDKVKASASAKDKGKTAVPAEVEEWITAAKTNARKSLYESHERLARYNVDPALIQGETPEEMTASANSLNEFVKELEGKVRGDVLEEHGFDPEPRTSTAPGRKSFKDMDSKEFNQLVEDALRG